MEFGSKELERENVESWLSIKNLIDNYKERKPTVSFLRQLWTPQASIMRFWHGTGCKAIAFGKEAEAKLMTRLIKEVGEDKARKQNISEQRLKFLIYRLGLLKGTLKNNKMKITPLEEVGSAQVNLGSRNVFLGLEGNTLEDETYNKLIGNS